MDPLVLTTALGIGLACGMRSFLAPLAVAALASAGVGIDVEGTGWEFVSEPAFLLVAVAGVAAGIYADRRGVRDEGVTGAVLGVAHIAFGAVLAAAAMAAEGESAAVGLAAGAVAAVGALAVLRDVVGGARRRVDPGAAALLSVYADGAALVVALLAVAFGPITLLAFIGLLVLARGRRRRDDRKYEGLRILRD